MLPQLEIIPSWDLEPHHSRAPRGTRIGLYFPGSRPGISVIAVILSYTSTHKKPNNSEPACFCYYVLAISPSQLFWGINLMSEMRNEK
jgi:hypothetical protein